jgi:glucose-6-phosphate isomerase
MKDIPFINLDMTESWKALKSLSPAPAAAESAEAVVKLAAPAGAGISYHWASMPVGDTHLKVLEEMAAEQQILEKYRLLASGEIINTGENRRVLHHLCRGELAGPVSGDDGEDIGAFYRRQKERFCDFARKVRKGSITGSTGKPFKKAVQIGIGGSDLGPRALYLALEGAVPPGTRKMEARFISNVDPDDAAEVLEGMDPETTLFILVSKSGTTQETLTNRDLVLSWMKSRGISGLDPAKHMIAVTSATSPLAGSPDMLDSFYIDDFVGGRYSSTSAVGGVVLSLAFGPEVFEELLSGAHEADKMALESPFRENAALLDASIGMYLRNVMGCSSTAVLPYSQALSRFPAHLQQLDMESNGKRVNRRGEPVNYPTGPVIFGEPGTNGQHSFYQLLHQGTDIIPLQFIGFRQCQRGLDIKDRDGLTSQRKLNANLSAQIAAFAAGKEHENPNKTFPGNRPSSLLAADRLSPGVLGALLAHFENKVMFQGFLWNLNSFDQEGVQLGKVLTGQVLSGKVEDPVLAAWDKLLQ